MPKDEVKYWLYTGLILAMLVACMLFAQSCSTQRHRVKPKNVDVIVIKSMPDSLKGGVSK